MLQISTDLVKTLYFYLSFSWSTFRLINIYIFFFASAVNVGQ